MEQQESKKIDYLTLIESDIDAFFDDFFADIDPGFLEELRMFVLAMRRKRSKNTVIAYCYDYRKFLMFAQKKWPNKHSWTELTYRNVEHYLSAGLIKRKKGTKKNPEYQNLSPASIERKTASLRKFFDYLIKDLKVISENPAISDSAIDDGKRERNIPDVLSESEAKALINAIFCREDKLGGRQKWMKERDLAIFTILLETGMRISEFCSMTMENAEEILDKKIFTVRGKRDKERKIPFRESGLDRLRDYLAVRPKVDTPNHRLWLAKSLDELDRMDVYQLLKTYAKRANIKEYTKLSPHKLRHTFATMLMENDVDIRMIQELLGHQSLETTQIYTKVQEERKLSAIEKLPNF